MNCFSHALPSLDNAYVATGCCIPDWLSAADRKCRVREKKATPFVDHDDPIVAAVAKGIVNHHKDDYWFHTNQTFQQMNIKFAVELRELLDGERGMRTGFLGHVLIELFLDAWLHEKFPGKLEFYYQQLESIDPEKVQDVVNLFATKQTDKLAPAIRGVIKERYLFDYTDDSKTLYRINRVLTRIGLEKIDDRILEWMKNARTRVYDRVPDLLDQYAIDFEDEE
ncbi:hypothetical protein [Mariniblastus fucicola]|uniref:Phospholipase C/D domain-containing protein n=1 Tax=Mariniblastus fucicola TaxID=980251 RepID=A0A5B9P9L9_9BACT|nr:hypothetical protein [Mariniblastus fucicola]QEG21935.1 hypothetical protein MFFC18_17960 [Mariniblastus fucicola]